MLHVVGLLPNKAWLACFFIKCRVAERRVLAVLWVIAWLARCRAELVWRDAGGIAVGLLMAWGCLRVGGRSASCQQTRCWRVAEQRGFVCSGATRGWHSAGQTLVSRHICDDHVY